jgi:3-methyladenine DNA glycosylase/8-oxoguanine DNA glycosylase
VPISRPVDEEANELLARNALAPLIAMLLDQQVPLERAFSAPRDLVRRLGHEPTAEELAAFDPEALAAVFSERPACQGEDLRGPARQAARRAARRLAGGRRAVRRGGLLHIGGGHHHGESLGKVRSYKQALKAAAKAKAAK